MTGFTGWDKEKTKEIQEWIINLPDEQKVRFALNWNIPHSIFNVACKMYPGGAAELQNVEWHKIHKIGFGPWERDRKPKKE